MVTFSALTKSLKPGTIHRQRGKPLGLPEPMAIALGGMVGGGIFSILGVSGGLFRCFWCRFLGPIEEYWLSVLRDGSDHGAAIRAIAAAVANAEE